METIGKIINAVDRYPVLTVQETNELANTIWLMKELFDTLKLEGKLADKIKQARKLKLNKASKIILENGFKAREKLFLHNQKFVIYCAQRIKSVNLEPEDLVQYGYLGLMEAVERFDPKRGFRFTTFAYLWVRSEMAKQRSLADSDFSITLDQTRRIYKINNAKQKFKSEYKRNPTIEELSKITGLSKSSIQNTLKHDHQSVSLQIDDEDSRGDYTATQLLVGGEDPLLLAIQLEQNKEATSLVEELLNCLPTKEAKEIFQDYYLEELPIKEVAKKNKTNTHKVRRILDENLRFLREIGL